MKRLMRGFLLIFFSTACIFPSDFSFFSTDEDSFWRETQKENPLSKDFDFQNKPRLEDVFGPVGYGFFRFFAIAVGTVPLSYLVGSQVYDWSVYAVRGGDPHWQPGFYGWENSRLTAQERTQRAWGVTAVVVGTSFLVAIIDTIIYHSLYSPKAKAKRGIAP